MALQQKKVIGLAHPGDPAGSSSHNLDEIALAPAKWELLHQRKRQSRIHKRRGNPKSVGGTGFEPFLHMICGFDRWAVDTADAVLNCKRVAPGHGRVFRQNTRGGGPR